MLNKNKNYFKGLPRRLVMIRCNIFYFGFFALLNFQLLATPLKINKLFCEYQENPLGIDVTQPRLNWDYITTDRNEVQQGYEIIVTELNNGNTTEVWATRKIISKKNTNIEYAGNPLKSFTRYFWKVRTYNEQNEVSEWSSAAWFETAMLDKADWQAKWIGDDRQQFEKDEDFYQDDRMPLFRKILLIKKEVVQARLYISGIGYYEAYLNGKKVGDRMLEPGWTTYKKEVLYSTYDVTQLIKSGKNSAGIMVGNGWYNPLPIRLFGRFNLRNAQETGRPCVKAEIHIQYKDGSKEQINTDESWWTALGPVIRNNTYLGEHYDSRLEQSGWLSNKDLPWKSVVIVKGPSGILHSQMQPPIRITKILKPISIKEIAPDKYIADFGQNFAGVARIRVKGAKGIRIKLKYGEALHADGTLNYLTTVAGQIKEIWNVKGGPGAPATAWQEDEYILNGSGVEEWNPRFTYHGFRFVEISGWPGKPDINSIEGLRMNADLQEAGTFSCSNEMFNQLHQVINWTFLSNVFSVQSDCPGREKMGYGADVVVTANAFMYNFNMSSFYEKVERDFANEQQPDGGITEIAPYTGIADRGYGGESGPLGWQLAFPYLQDQLYEFYGDSKIIAQNYTAFQKQIEFLKTHAIQGLYHWDIGDHVTIDPKAEAFSASAFYYHHVILASKFAGILKKKEDSISYSKLATEIKQTIIQKYNVPNTGRFDNATQAAQSFALWYDLPTDTNKALEVLEQEIKRHNNHVSSGIFGVKMMFDVLRENNRNELAYAVANQHDFPSWGYMLAKGATTLWEDWNYPDNAPSQNHPMFGSIDEWFYRSLLGINAASPGFDKIIIKPQPVSDLTWAKGSYNSIKGKIASDWKMNSHEFELTVSIPSNTTATIIIPCNSSQRISESGIQTTIFKFEKGLAYIQVGSGVYHFKSKL